MTPSEFETTGIAITRSAVGWQSKLATVLGVKSRTVRRWIAEGRETGVMPASAQEAITRAMGQADTRSVWPRGEWLIGYDEHDRLLVQHLQSPRFTARVVMTDGAGNPLPEEGPADVLSGTVYVAVGDDPEGETLLCEIAWIDEPSPGEVTQLLEAASDAHDRWIDDRYREGGGGGNFV